MHLSPGVVVLQTGYIDLVGCYRVTIIDSNGSDSRAVAVTSLFALEMAVIMLFALF